MLHQKRHIGTIVGLVVLVLAVVVVIYGINKNSSKSAEKQPSKTQPSVTQPPYSPNLTPKETSTPTASTVPEEIKPTGNATSSVPGGTRGQITCNYQIPAAPNQYGSASIESNWNNLVLGKNASAKLAICVSVNGTSSLISVDSHTNGSRVDSAPWISLSTDYVFTLYDDHGGDLPDCGGIVLSSCDLNTNSH